MTTNLNNDTKVSNEQKNLLKESNNILKDALKNKSNIAKKDFTLDFLNSKNVANKLNNLKTKIVEKKSNNLKNRDSLYNYTFIFSESYKLDYSKIDKVTFKKYDKSIRRVMRNKRNAILNNIIFYATKKMGLEFKNEFNKFELFYKTYYLTNDYSLNSLCSNNSDNDTKDLINESLFFIKSFKESTTTNKVVKKVIKK